MGSLGGDKGVFIRSMASRGRLGGLSQGSEYDHLDVAGEWELNGKLIVHLLSGYIPEAGDVFNLFDWGTLLGVFNGIDISAAALPDHLRWDTSELYRLGSISVAPVPLPGAVWLFFSGLCLLRIRAVMT